MRVLRGGPGDFWARLERARALDASPAATEPLALVVAALGHHIARAADPTVRCAASDVASEVVSNRLLSRFPLLHLEAAVGSIAAEIEPAVGALAPHVPAPLAAASRDISTRALPEQSLLVARWLDDPALLEPRSALWIRLAAAPILELAARGVDVPSREEWAGRACPLCGDTPQCSAIVEESGAFLQGSPRYLICGRCASWWPFPRATCPACGEDDSRRLGAYVPEAWAGARVDVCDTCRHYTKTFDLRQRDAKDVIPLVDDVATLALDVWAHQQDLRRAVVSLAGV